MTEPNPVTLITGTRTGIGQALAQHYASAGHQVVGCSRGEPEWPAPDNYRHVCLDVTDDQAVLQLFREIRTRHRRLDNLINNAGVSSMNHALLTPMSTMRKMMDTNVNAPFLFSREAAKLMMRGPGGRIVNIGSVLTALKVPGEAAYTASKAALQALGEALSLELATHGITVNTLGVGPTETDMLRGVPSDKMQRVIDRQTLPRMCTMAEIIHATDFFLHPQSGGITGQTLFFGGV